MKNRHRLPARVLLLLTFAAFSSVTTTLAQPLADPPELVTDRPDQTESSSLVPPGWVQVETGAVYEKKERVTVTSLGTTLVRVGLLDRLELRFTGEYTRIESDLAPVSAVTEGFGGISAGVKIGIAEEGVLLPEMAFIGHLSLPIGDDSFRSEYIHPDFRFTFSKSFGDVFGLSGNIGAEWGGSEIRGTGLYTLALGADLTDEFGMYAEIFGHIQGESSEHMADVGVTYLLARNAQLDASFGVPLSEDAPDYYAGVGFSFRLPR